MTAVITGVGVVSAFGIGAGPFFGGLTEGRSGIGRIRSFDASTFPTQVAGEQVAYSARSGEQRQHQGPQARAGSTPGGSGRAPIDWDGVVRSLLKPRARRDATAAK